MNDDDDDNNNNSTVKMIDIEEPGRRRRNDGRMKNKRYAVRTRVEKEALKRRVQL